MIRVPYNLACASPPMLITDNDDVQFALLQEQVSKVPLVVSTIRRESIDVPSSTLHHDEDQSIPCADYVLEECYTGVQEWGLNDIDI